MEKKKASRACASCAIKFRHSANLSSQNEPRHHPRHMISQPIYQMPDLSAIWLHDQLYPLIDSLPSTVPFVGPETILRRSGIPMRARIGANENVFGPSPKAIAAMQEAARESWKYGDPEVHDLRAAIAKHHGIGIENITVGEGIDGLLGIAVRLFVEPGITVASSLGAYPTCNFHVAGFGGRLVTTPYVNDHEDPASLLDLAKKETPA